MASFAEASTITREFRSIEALGAGFVSWEVQATQLRATDFRARVEVAATAGVQLTRLTCNTPVLLLGANPPKRTGFAFAVSAPGGIRSRGRNIDVLTTAPSRSPGDEIHFLTQGPLDGVAVVMDHDRFAQELRDRFHIEADRLGRDWWLRTRAGTPDCRQRAQAMIALQKVIAGGAASSVEACRRLEDCILQIVFEGFDADGSARLAAVPLRRRLALQVDRLLRERLDDPPSLGELCNRLGTAERTLHLAFHEAFGMPPKPYLRALRLGAAHRRLRNGQGPVTAVATDLGFFQFGRFAAEYKAMFGEMPSESLRRGLGRRETAPSWTPSPDECLAAPP